MLCYAPEVTETRPSFVNHLEEILPYGKDAIAEAEIEHEYLPFAAAKLTAHTCAAFVDESVCGLVIQQSESCECWINMPTFKSTP